MSISPHREEVTTTSKRLPGDEGVWVFIGADMMMFGVFFVTFVHDRLKDVALYESSRLALNPTVGAINTLLLLAGSLFVVRALEGAREGSVGPVRRNLLLAIFSGVGFAISKFFEYRSEIAAGHTLVSNDFFMFYFAFTGVHLAHLLLGLAVLMWLRSSANEGVGTARYVKFLECGGIYWHMVDLLWIMLFPLLYLLKA